MRTRAVACCLALLAVLGGPARAQLFTLVPPDTVTGNFFGAAVALDGDRALVGASGEASCGGDGGAAYVYERTDADGWRRTARLVPGDCEPGDFFGRSLALSGDVAVVAAFRPYFSEETSNTAYVFERQADGTWAETARLRADPSEPEGAFAASVALDGGRVLITTTGDPNGTYGGAAYVFARGPDGRWRREARLTGDGVEHGIFGTAGALDGDRAVVAASTFLAGGPGSVYVFERKASGAWYRTARLGGVDDFFISVAIDGDHVLVGEAKQQPRATGAATLYRREPDGTWTLDATLRPETPYQRGAFGSAVALDGDRALVVGFDEQLRFDFNIDRVVYVFVRDPATDAWHQARILDIGAVHFGSAIALDGGQALIGEASDGQPGRAYVARLP